MSWKQKIVLFVTVIISIALLISYSSLVIAPSKIWVVAFFGLAYLPLLIVFILLLIYWLFNRLTIFIVLLIILLIGYKAHVSSFAFHKSNEEELADAYKLLTYNVHGFDAYNPDEAFLHREDIVQSIINEEADIIALQEFNTYHNHPTGRDVLQELLQQTGYKYQHYYKAYENKKNTRSFGLIIISKYPITNSGVLQYESLSKLNATIYADINLNGNMIRVFTTHLQSTQLTHQDFEFVDKSHPKDSVDFNAERIAGKLKNSYMLRASQVDTIKKAINNSPYPAIICGDFNDTPVSYSYQKISNGMQDAFLKKGRGFGATYVDLPVIRIDYMLYNKCNFEIVDYNRIRPSYSDHYPLVSSFIFSDKNCE